MAIKARMYVQEIAMYNKNGGGKVRLQVVSRGEENKSYAQATPSGHCELSITNPEAFTQFKDHLNGEVVLTFEFDEEGAEPTQYR